MYPIRIGKEFINQKYNVYGLCVSGTQVAKGMREAGIETFEVSSKKKLLILQILQLNKWLKQRNVTVIHCHKSGDILVSALLSILTKRTTLFTEHMGVTRPKKDLYHKWVYSHVNSVFSISNETLQRNLKALPVAASKISRLWLGTDIPNSPIDDIETIRLIKEELGLDPTATIIGNVGRLCLGKGQLELLNAFAKLTPTYPQSHLLLVGGIDANEGADGEFVTMLKHRVSELHLKERVHFVGFRRDTDRMLAIMDIVCIPSHNEAFGLTVIEAMAAKKAIIAANTGALPEVLGNSALFCNPLSSNDITTAIRQYIENPELSKSNASKAFQRAQSEFSMQTHIKRLEHYINQIQVK
ncbi:glycosyltransferase [Vibrio sp. 404]|uniref:Glycosyltransferase n=2 Tax=Vibrio marinisediminis TaxID=2758441 RepID=A0A7W2FRA7_9VIBR|nr:glycosyltransferase [Vibrio marinisediminis]